MRRVLGHYSASSGLALGILEGGLVAAVSCATFYYFVSNASIPGIELVPYVLILALGIVALMHSGGLYDVNAVLSLKRTLWRIAAVTVPIFLLAIWTTGQLAKYSGVSIYPYRWQWTGVLTAVWLLSAILLRVLVQHIHRSGFFARRIVLIGMDSYARQLDDFPRWTHERCRFVAELDADALNSPAELATLVARENASEVVVAVGSKPLPWHVLAYCKVSGIRVTDYLDFYERESRRVCTENLREDWIALSRGFHRSKLSMQRPVDLLLSVAGFVATAPVLLFTALAIKLEDGGPIFYRQERVGLGGRSFVLIKFRSMHLDAESDGTPAWAVERDMRITRVGRLIRMVRIDELPQLWNVVCGDMSIIGPRPERPYFVRQFSQLIPFYDYRHAVRPGITGWAQVSYHYGASLEDARRKLSYDLYYIKNRGMMLALVILLKTIGVVARGQGAR